jgi:hypothetical protein
VLASGHRLLAVAEAAQAGGGHEPELPEPLDSEADLLLDAPAAGVRR